MSGSIVMSFGEALDLLGPDSGHSAHIGKQLTVVFGDAITAFVYLSGSPIDSHIFEVESNVVSNPSEYNPNFVQIIF